MILDNQTPNQCLYYVYQYIRLDKNEPFYIGIGKRYKGKTDFRRARQTHKHNDICLNIIAKTDYKIEIIEESDDYSFIQNREIELIKLYGRRQNNTGILANMTDGGQGMLGTKSPKSKPIYAYDKNGNFVMEFESGHAAGRYLEIHPTCICEAARKFGTYMVKSLQLSYTKYDKLPMRLNNKEKLSQRCSKIRVQMDLNDNIIKEWQSANVAALELGLKREAISRCCDGFRKTAGGFKWKNKEN